MHKITSLFKSRHSLSGFHLYPTVDIDEGDCRAVAINTVNCSHDLNYDTIGLSSSSCY